MADAEAAAADAEASHATHAEKQANSDAKRERTAELERRRQEALEVPTGAQDEEGAADAEKRREQAVLHRSPSPFMAEPSHVMKKACNNPEKCYW